MKSLFGQGTGTGRRAGLSGGLCAASLVAEQPFELPHITVFGTAVTNTAPDILRWELEVKTVAATPAEATQRQNKRMAVVMAFLKDFELRDNELQTSFMSIDEERAHRSNSWVKIGYAAETEIAFTLRDLDGYVALWDGLAALDGVEDIEVRWDIDERIAIQNETRLRVLQAARGKALVLSEAAGVFLAEPLLIEEIPGDSGSRRNHNFASNSLISIESVAADGPEVIAPGAIAIQIRVKVVYRIVED